jgi:DNA-directed RNA polymerase specialized sigma24 family protein
MEVTPVKTPWGLTRESFDGLLALFDSDRERAGEHYEILRAKLVRLFEWRGSAAPEEYADTTLNRVARKVEEGEAVRDVHAFAGGVARMVWLEAIKRERREREALEQMPQREEIADKSDARLGCFRTCLDKLPGDERALAVEYYRKEKGAKIEARKKLATSIGTQPGALRLRVCRLRTQLEKCVGNCLKKSAGG